MVARKPSADSSASDPQEGVLAAAGGFTGLWALTWLSASAAPVSLAVQGGLAVGSVMASSGLTLLWWKTRAMRHLAEAEEDEEPDGEPVVATGDPLAEG